MFIQTCSIRVCFCRTWTWTKRICGLVTYGAGTWKLYHQKVLFPFYSTFWSPPHCSAGQALLWPRLIILCPYWPCIH